MVRQSVDQNVLARTLSQRFASVSVETYWLVVRWVCRPVMRWVRRPFETGQRIVARLARSSSAICPAAVQGLMGSRCGAYGQGSSRVLPWFLFAVQLPTHDHDRYTGDGAHCTR